MCLIARKRTGRANVALEILVARRFAVPKYNVTWVGGQKLRITNATVGSDLHLLQH